MNLRDIMQRFPVWRGSTAPVFTAETLTTGYAGLDARLGGGWPCAALTEILCAREGVGELRVLLPTLAQITRQKRWLAFIAPPHLPYAPALAYAGLDLSRILLVSPATPRDTLWAVEQTLRAGTCGAVLTWLAQADFTTLRRLQLAAEAGKTWGVLFRPLHAAQQPTPALLRVKLEPVGSGVQTLAVHVLKYRFGVSSTPLVLDVNLTHPPP